MNYREVEIYAPTDLGAAGTKTIDINIRDMLSSIEIIWRTTVATVSDMTAPHVACLSKIEIVDGSDVLFSLSGEEAHALGFYGHGINPFDDISVDTTELCTSVIPILFGRKLFDRQLAFDPTRFTNPQLKITWDEDASGASVIVNELTVRGWAFDGRSITPEGFLMSKEIKSYTPAANTYEYTDLPTDYPYRLLLFRSKSTDTEPFSVLNQFKLSEEHDKKIPFDMTGAEIFRKFVAPLGMVHQRVSLNETAADAQAIYGVPTYLHRGIVDYDLDVIAANDDATNLVYTNNLVTIAATVSLVPHLLVLEGYAPHSCFSVPFGDINEIDDFYNVSGIGNLRLTTQGGAAVGTSPEAQICLQQMRPY